MWRKLIVLTLGAAMAIPCAALAQETKKPAKPEIKGGIEGKVKKVDAEKKTLTVTMADGKDRTFTITDDTTMVGPRGGLVRRRLKDPRFHQGLDITVVATGTTAKELHLGFDRNETGTASKPATPAKGTRTDSGSKSTTKPTGTAANKGAATDKAGDTEDMEFPGKVKSVDPAKHMLVVTLLNGRSRSFMIAKDVKLMVKGKPSTKGLEDPALKTGASLTVVTDPEGRKVKEVKMEPAAANKKKGS